MKNIQNTNFPNYCQSQKKFSTFSYEKKKITSFKLLKCFSEASDTSGEILSVEAFLLILNATSISSFSLCNKGDDIRSDSETQNYKIGRIINKKCGWFELYRM